MLLPLPSGRASIFSVFPRVNHQASLYGGVGESTGQSPSALYRFRVSQTCCWDCGSPAPSLIPPSMDGMRLLRTIQYSLRVCLVRSSLSESIKPVNEGIHRTPSPVYYTILVTDEYI